ncbi:MAG TPA: glycerol-3-phosphate 1-O-acyltransferase PlsY [Stellaceae bacterium]|nr:glycerol-3-phosphate 1-O-acyltransferase PlsY [Stellaceae bacterium]
MTIPSGDWGAILGCFVLAYFCGSIPFGLIFTRLAGHGDIRNIGSGNIGATNVLRTGNKKLAAIVFVCDFIKGFVPVFIAWRFGAEAAAAAAVGAPLGHIFPVWLGFKGGKGVATGGGVLVAYCWPIALLAVLVWLVMAIVFRYSSLAAVTAAIAVPVYAWLMRPPGISPIAITVIALVVIWRHRSNLVRLIRSEEDKIGPRKNHASTKPG